MVAGVSIIGLEVMGEIVVKVAMVSIDVNIDENVKVYKKREESKTNL